MILALVVVGDKIVTKSSILQFNFDEQKNSAFVVVYKLFENQITKYFDYQVGAQ